MQFMIQVIAEIIESHLLRVGALAALGRRFEYLSSDSNNPSHIMISQPVFIYCLNSVLNDCGQIADKRFLIER